MKFLKQGITVTSPSLQINVYMNIYTFQMHNLFEYTYIIYMNNFNESDCTVYFTFHETNAMEDSQTNNGVTFYWGDKMLFECYKVVTEALMMNETGVSEVQLSPHLQPHARPATPYIIPVICSDPLHQVPLATMPLI